MRKSELGIIAIIFGGLVLSLELCGLKFLYTIVIKSGYQFRETALDYLFEPNVLLAAIIAVSVNIFGIVLIIKDKKSGT